MEKECTINASHKEQGYEVWCCHTHSQEYCDKKNVKKRKFSKSDERELEE